MNTLLISNMALAVVATAEGKVITEEGSADGANTEGTMVDPTLGTGVEVKDPLLSTWPFVIGVSAAVLLVSIALGAFLAKRKIKKGIDLYED
ncbi:MAG: hypothetical protein PHF63_08065 [Herbinix sp.]|nr:hypothetical protein [Herbinix sp.]